MPRQNSPYNPARRALLEPIWQPLYSSAVLTGATPETKLSFFPVPAASQNDPVLANLSINQLSNPKMFTIEGFRLHIAQKHVLYAANANVVWDDVVAIIEQYWYRVFVGAKEYLRVPAFWVPSGIGLTGCVDVGSAAAYAAIATQGVTHHENYAKIKRLPITIPPQQQFECDLNALAAGVAAISANRRIWTFWEGRLGREVQ
jgi:hypothetical protein